MVLRVLRVLGPGPRGHTRSLMCLESMAVTTADREVNTLPLSPCKTSERNLTLSPRNLLSSLPLLARWSLVVSRGSCDPMLTGVHWVVEAVVVGLTVRCSLARACSRLLWRAERSP